MSITILQEKIREKKTPVALGLYPDPEKISPKIRQNFEDMFGPGDMANAEALRYHGTQALDAAASLPAVMIHASSYLSCGMMGADVLWNLISAAKSRGMYVILDLDCTDAKLWWRCGADALTINPYAYDSAQDVPEKKAVFAVVRTRNGSSVQSLRSGDRPLYIAVSERMARQGAGLVIDTGYSLDIKELRRRCDKAFLLLPSCNGENAVSAFDDYGHGALAVNFDLQYTHAVNEAVKEMKEWVSVL